jgi:glycosidase
MEWHDEAVFYHIYVFGLCGAPFQNDYCEKADRLGELAKWIPQMKGIGCDAVMLSPINKSRSHGYDTTGYFEVDNRIGDNAGFKKLVGKFHSAGVRVVLDGVFNHVGRDFFAFKDVLEKRQGSPYAGWISGLDFSAGNGDGFAYDTWAGYRELVKLNLKNKDVSDHLLEAVRFWIDEYDIDGLRLDAANVLDFGFMGRLRLETQRLKPQFWLMGEVVSGDYSRWANPEILHSVTNYELYKGIHSSHNDRNMFELAHTLNRQFGKGGLLEGKKLYNFVDNHDQDRLASVLKKQEHLYTAYIILFTVPGIPSIYYGSEWGIEGVRGNGSDAAIRPAIDISSAAKAHPDLQLAIAKLSSIRKASPALMHGDYRQVYLKYMSPFAFARAYGDETVIVAVNPYEEGAAIDAGPQRGDFYDLLNDETIRESELRSIWISPHWGRILKAMN